MLSNWHSLVSVSALPEAGLALTCTVHIDRHPILI